MFFAIIPHQANHDYTGEATNHQFRHHPYPRLPISAVRVAHTGLQRQQLGNVAAVFDAEHRATQTLERWSGGWGLFLDVQCHDMNLYVITNILYK